MPKVMVKFEGNWADEMDLSGFRVMEKPVWEAHLARVKRFLSHGGYEKCVGTNENIEYSNYAEYKRSFEVIDLSEEEAKLIKRLLGEDYGQFAAIGREEMDEHPEPEDENCDLEY